MQTLDVCEPFCWIDSSFVDKFDVQKILMDLQNSLLSVALHLRKWLFRSFLVFDCFEEFELLVLGIIHCCFFLIGGMHLADAFFALASTAFSVCYSNESVEILKAQKRE